MDLQCSIFSVVFPKELSVDSPHLVTHGSSQQMAKLLHQVPAGRRAKKEVVQAWDLAIPEDLQLSMARFDGFAMCTYMYTV